MFSTRRRRRALVLVGIGYVGAKRRAALLGVTRVDAINGSTLFPSRSLGTPRGVRSSPTRSSDDFSALTRGAHTSSPPIASHDSQRGRGARVRRAPRVPRQPRGGGRGAGCRAGTGSDLRRGDAFGASVRRGGADPPVAVTRETVAARSDAAATGHARRLGIARAGGLAFAAATHGRPRRRRGVGGEGDDERRRKAVHPY